MSTDTNRVVEGIVMIGWRQTVVATKMIDRKRGLTILTKGLFQPNANTAQLQH